MADLKETIKWSLLTLLAVAILVVGITALNGSLYSVVYPWWLSIQRNAVEHSKSFTDANNNMLSTYMLEYSRLDTKIAEAEDNAELAASYESQQKAILQKMCQEVATMQMETVNPDTRSWLNSKGGCK